jgi:1-acyl-sn-glycerol-3-phosphate acyltransferase
MTPPGKPKRPSARPPSSQSRSPSASQSPAPASPPSSIPPPPVATEKVEASQPEAPKQVRAADKKPRISARRAPGAASSEVSEPKVQNAAPEKAAVTARPAKLRKPTVSSNGKSHKLPEAPAPVPTTPSIDAGEALDDDDIWSEADAGPSARIEQLAGESAASSAPVSAAPEPEPVARLARSRREGQRDEAVMLGSAQTLVSTDYYFRQYGAHGIRSLSAEVDEFGLDPHVEERSRPWLESLCKHYFRVDVDGAQHVPESGRVLMVCNRAGTLPWDGLVLRTALRMMLPQLQPVRWLAEDGVFHYPFLGVFMNRLGAVRACPENAERLLRQDRLVAVFPEGAQGSDKLFKDRYRLQRFGRGGYVKLALKHGAPIVPTAIIGAEETNPVLARSKWLGRALGADSLPITPTFPWLGLAGLLPAPVKWRIVVGEPIDLSSYGPKSADDALVVHRLNEQIRGILQNIVDQARGSRRSVLFG